MDRKKLLLFFTTPGPLSRKLVLALGSIAAIVIFFCLPANTVWLQERILNPLIDFKTERNRMGLEQRMKYRFDSVYIYSKQIESFFKKKGIEKSTLVLMPPTSYFEQNNMDYHVPEPAVFYYYTGLKTLWANSTNAADANWYVWVSGGKIMFDSVSSRQSLLDTIAAFKKLGVAL